MRHTVRFDNLALPDPRAEEWDWQMNAACRDVDTSLFFDIIRSGGAEEQIAKYISSRCPVTERCRQYAVDAHEPHGIWGATAGPNHRVASSRVCNAIRGCCTGESDNKPIRKTR
jgi:WhiB family redox-sensing transcriptional regulator